jgi:GTP cyclohydrolase II
LFSFDGVRDGGQHVALARGDRADRGVQGGEGVPLVRLHSECLTGDVLGSERCDCGQPLGEATDRINEVGSYLLYLRQEGRGICLYNKIDAYALEEAGLDPYEANVVLGFGEDDRDYGGAVQMLLAPGVDRLDLLSSDPEKAAQLGAAGIRIEGRVPTGLHLTSVNGRYLVAKAGHGQRLLGLG